MENLKLRLRPPGPSLKEVYRKKNEHAFQGSQSKENEAHVKQKRFASCAQILKIPKSTIKKGFFTFRAIVEFNLRV